RKQNLAPAQGWPPGVPISSQTHRNSLEIAALLFCGAYAAPALAQDDVRTPWANIYVGPGGVYVNGPWGRVNVPAADRERVCSEWRKSTTEHYEGRGCTVTFADEGCLIERVECGK
ncbi:MAG TPA: hypothetical protein VFR71_01595, partial [Methyloceanibacter sp.]|nr:hypothetical protein [Methyloceanibacter sp.]